MVVFEKAVIWFLMTACEWLSEASHRTCLWFFLGCIAAFYSFTAAALTLVAVSLTWIASMKKHPVHLPLYQGTLDVMMGRTFRASTVTEDMPANNNVSIATFGDQVVIAYRKALTHFASSSAQIVVATSDNLKDWTTVWTYSTGQDDLREVLLWEFNGKMLLYFATLAPYKKGFSPRGMHWTSTTNLKDWTKPVAMGRATEITWDVKVREEDSVPVAYKVGYTGNHYAADAVLTVVFEKSYDGEQWEPVGKEIGVYVGGICEVSFDFTANGDLVAIGRNEDGDHTGFGSQLFFAPKDDLGSWTSLKVSLPYRFDSPRLVTLEGELVLFARYAQENYGFAPDWFPMNLQRVINLVIYSMRPKSAAVYHMCTPDEKGIWPEEPIELIRCFEECHGDTGFFSITRLPKSDEWAIANYSSRCHSHASWIYGQLLPTDVNVVRCLPVHRK